MVSEYKSVASTERYKYHISHISSTLATSNFLQTYANLARTFLKQPASASFHVIDCHLILQNDQRSPVTYWVVRKVSFVL